MRRATQYQMLSQTYFSRQNFIIRRTNKVDTLPDGVISPARPGKHDCYYRARQHFHQHLPHISRKILHPSGTAG